MSIPSKAKHSNRSTLRIAFLAAVALKGIDGLAETLAGILVAFLGTQGVYDLVIQLTAPEFDLHRQNRAVHLLRHGASSFAHASSRFVVIWLIAHGIVKLALAIELLRGKTWVFPVAITILSGFVGYMTYRLAGHFSWWPFAFALFDAMTVALVLNEWRARRGRTR